MTCRRAMMHRLVMELRTTASLRSWITITSMQWDLRGSINSNVNDMAKWVTTWINDGKFNGKEIIPASHRNEAISSQLVIGGALPDKKILIFISPTMALDGFSDPIAGIIVQSMAATSTAFQQALVSSPSDSIGIIVLSNQNSSSVPSVVRNLIAG